MASTFRLYFDASYAIAVMAVAGIVAGFATAGITGDSERGLQVALAAFALTGTILTVRLWRITRKTALSPVAPIRPKTQD